METYSFNNHALRRFHETIEDAVDPSGIISPGRYGIWPKYWCATCHGPGLAGTVAMQTKYNGSKPALLVERTDVPPAVTKAFVRKGVTIMPFFRKTEISDADLDALAAYLARNTGSK